MVLAMRDQPQANPELDAATICRLARLPGLELDPPRAARLLADFVA